jgi:hypothetical protein
MAGSGDRRGLQAGRQSGSKDEQQQGGTPTFINEAHILLVGWGEDLTAVGWRAGAAVPLAVVDDSGDRGAGGSPAITMGLGTEWCGAPHPR